MTQAQKEYNAVNTAAANYPGKEIAIDLDTLTVIAVADTYDEAMEKAKKIKPNMNFTMWNYFDPKAVSVICI